MLLKKTIKEKESAGFFYEGMNGTEMEKFLLENKIIDGILAAKLKNAKGMRNILSHQYGSIDDELVFDSIKHELVKDVKDFLKVISNL